MFCNKCFLAGINGCGIIYVLKKNKMERTFMNTIILGNLFSLIAMGSDTFSATRKSAKAVLLVQCVSQFLYGMSSLVLKGYSAVVQSTVSIVRNLVAVKGNTAKWIEWMLVALGVGLGLLFNNLGTVGLLPVISNLEYSVAVFLFRENEKALKIAFLINIALFAVFNAAILNIVGVAGNLVVAGTTAVSLYKEWKE